MSIFTDLCCLCSIDFLGDFGCYEDLQIANLWQVVGSAKKSNWFCSKVISKEGFRKRKVLDMIASKKGISCMQSFLWTESCLPLQDC